MTNNKNNNNNNTEDIQNKQALYEKKRAIKEKRADGKLKQKQQQLPIAKRGRGRPPALLTEKGAE